MKNILYEGYLGPRLPREVQLKRVQRVMQEELTPLQRETLIAFSAEKGTNRDLLCAEIQEALEEN